jgi:energy-coupling factor transporter transmembrane protein EcfT
MRPRTKPTTAKIAALKVVYLLAVSAVAFIVPAVAATQPTRWFVVLALLILQVAILRACRIGISEVVRPVWRLWLFLFLIGCYVLLPPEHPGASAAILHWRIWKTKRAQPIRHILAGAGQPDHHRGQEQREDLEAHEQGAVEAGLELFAGAQRSGGGRGDGTGRGRGDGSGRGASLSTVKQLLRGFCDGSVCCRAPAAGRCADRAS